ncbi:MAG: hypothetical protein QS721_14085 [Candidatus Endonucleobacter sp. (ex Gigantidas childressi)]|nr:hypothetical protein [Candidatus Endonucleobacter sp. (ex Gigantidas childressi)]
MQFICNYIIKNTTYIFISTIFLFVLHGFCYGLELDRGEIYYELLEEISSINKTTSSNAIVLHGSVAWQYIMAEAKGDSLKFKDITVNDLDFLVQKEHFEEAINILRNKMSKLCFKTRTTHSDNITWCCCYFRTENSTVVRIADFVKMDKSFSDDDILYIEEDRFNLHIETATCILEYEKQWLNKLKTKIHDYTAIIKDKGNKWLALAFNSDSVYLVYKSFMKYDEHLTIFDQITPSKRAPFDRHLDIELIKAKDELDKVIFIKNSLLSHLWGIHITIPKENETNPDNQEPPHKSMILATAQMETEKPDFNEYDIKTDKRESTKKNTEKSCQVVAQPQAGQRENSATNECITNNNSLRKRSLNNKAMLSSKIKHPNKKLKNKSNRNPHHKEKKLYSEGGSDALNMTNDFDNLSLCTRKHSSDVLSMTNSFDNLSIREGKYSSVHFNNTNPFTYSFSEKVFYAENSKDKRNNATWMKNYYTHMYPNIIRVCFFAVIMYIYSEPLATQTIETIDILRSNFLELFCTAITFTVNSDCNWMITWPAVLTLLGMKYKRKKISPMHVATLGLLSVYSSIYTYKFISQQSYSYNAEPCTFPHWMTKIKYIPKYALSDDFAYLGDPIDSMIMTPEEWITPDQLTCENIMLLENGLDKAKHSISTEIQVLENCGLINDTHIFQLCYNTDWSRYDAHLHLLHHEMEKHDYKDVRISAQPAVGTRDGEIVSGYEFGCKDNQGKYFIPPFQYNPTKVKNKILILELDELDNAIYSLKQLISNEYGYYWATVTNIIKEGKNIFFTKRTAAGVYVLVNQETTEITAAICFMKNKMAVHHFR